MYSKIFKMLHVLAAKDELRVKSECNALLEKMRAHKNRYGTVSPSLEVVLESAMESIRKEVHKTSTLHKQIKIAYLLEDMGKEFEAN